MTESAESAILRVAKEFHTNLAAGDDQLFHLSLALDEIGHILSNHQQRITLRQLTECVSFVWTVLHRPGSDYPLRTKSHIHIPTEVTLPFLTSLALKRLAYATRPYDLSDALRRANCVCDLVQVWKAAAFHDKASFWPLAWCISALVPSANLLIRNASCQESRKMLDRIAGDLFECVGFLSDKGHLKQSGVWDSAADLCRMIGVRTFAVLHAQMNKQTAFRCPISKRRLLETVFQMTEEACKDFAHLPQKSILQTCSDEGFRFNASLLLLDTSLEDDCADLRNDERRIIIELLAQTIDICASASHNSKSVLNKEKSQAAFTAMQILLSSSLIQAVPTRDICDSAFSILLPPVKQILLKGSVYSRELSRVYWGALLLLCKLIFSSWDTLALTVKSKVQKVLKFDLRKDCLCSFVNPFPEFRCCNLEQRELSGLLTNSLLRPHAASCQKTRGNLINGVLELLGGNVYAED